MLDAVLVEHFHGAHRQHRTGLLTAGGDDAEVRFLFENGNPIAVEFGCDKERLLADALLEYHRITPAFHAIAIAANANGQGTVSEMVLRHQIATDEEVARTTQSMVEDALCRAFSGNSTQVNFIDGAGTESLDFARRAFRLRIDSEVLLRTARTRIDEIHAAYVDDHDWSAVYVFAEGAGSGVLGEYEKRVLNDVDGTRTVTDIAIVCRDSCLNMGRILRGLAQKGVIRRGASTAAPSGHSSAQLQAIRPPTTTVGAPSQSAVRPATAAATSPAQNAADFTPVRRYVEPTGGGLTFMRVVLLAALVAVALVGWLIVDYRKQQNALAEVVAEIDDMVARGAWNDATAMIDAARKKAGKDVSAQRLVDGMQERYRSALNAESDGIKKLIADEDFVGARKRLLRLGNDDAGLTQQLANAETVQSNRQAQLIVQVELALNAENVRAADAILKGITNTSDQDVVVKTIDRWRESCLTAAASPAAPLVERRARLALALALPPGAQQMQTATRIQGDITRRTDDLTTAILRWRTRCDAGETQAVAEEIRGMNLGELLAGDPLLDQAQSILDQIEKLTAEVATFRAAAAGAISTGDAERFALVRKQAEAALTQTNNSPVIPLAKQCLAILADLEAVPTGEPAQAQAEAIRAIVNARPTDAEFSKALTQRADQVADRERRAQSQFADILTIKREGDLVRAHKNLTELIALPDLRGTVAMRNADQELDLLNAAIARRGTQRTDLDKAIADGDVPGAWSIARAMGLRQLPLSLDSNPSGATVLRDGIILGTTPLTLDIPSADRVDQHFELHLEGYANTTVDGANAEGGWHLATHLERSPIATGALPAGVTNQPVVTTAGVAVVNRQALYLIAIDGTHRVRPFANAAVDDPIYAPVIEDGKRLVVPTRDLVALAVTTTDGDVERIPLAVRTDVLVTIHRSALVVNRDLLLTVNLAGTLVASDPSGTVAWSRVGSPLIIAPVLTALGALIVSRDGQVACVSADDGSELATATLGGPVIAAWSSAGVIHAFTETHEWVWNGETASQTALPAPIIAGAAGVIVTVPRRILIHNGSEWKDLGRLEPEATLVSAWKGHAVSINGKRLVVYGTRGFQATAKSELLMPVVLGERLVVIDQGGVIAIYE